jgi:AcrR family transcriptional regulator
MAPKRASAQPAKSPAPRKAAKTVRTRKEQALETRALLKEAIKTVLSRIGYRQMRIADVTNEAGVAVGLFYHYFPDLKTGTCEVLSDFMAQITAKARRVPHSGDLFDTLRAQYNILIEDFEKHPGLMRCMIQASDEIPEFGEIWKASNRQWTNSFARYLAECLGDEHLAGDTALLLAYCLGSMSDGIMHEYYIQRNPDLITRIRSRNDLAETLATLTYRALFLANPAPEKLHATAEQIANSGGRGAHRAGKALKSGGGQRGRAVAS